MTYFYLTKFYQFRLFSFIFLVIPYNSNDYMLKKNDLCAQKSEGSPRIYLKKG